jgi:photosystem II stability/assembly factor-like uncharacterized protein
MKLSLLLAAPFVLLASLAVIWEFDHSRSHGRVDAIFFDGDEHGFVHVCCARPAQMYETRDEGRTWILSSSTEPRFRRGKVFVSSTKGFSVEEDQWPHNEIHVTEDGGQTWKRVFRTNQQGEFIFGNIQAVSQTEIWAGFYRTDDGGLTWRKASLPGGLFYFLSREQGWSVGQKAVWTTDDGGLNWKRLTDLPDLTDKEHGWPIGGSQENNVEGGALRSILWATEDGGTTWQRRPVLQGHYLGSIFFLDEKRGWAGGTGATLLRTRDGGRTWTAVKFP